MNLWKKHINPIADSIAYSLQPNHFHFLIRTKDLIVDEDAGNRQLIQSFSNCFNSYSKSINKAYCRTGSLFQERYGRKMIDTEDYYTQVIWYIHSNSQKHGIVKDFKNYPFCSYQSILSHRPTHLLRIEVLEWFGSREAFINFHKEDPQNLIEYLNHIEF